MVVDLVAAKVVPVAWSGSSLVALALVLPLARRRRAVSARQIATCAQELVAVATVAADPAAILPSLHSVHEATGAIETTRRRRRVAGAAFLAVLETAALALVDVARAKTAPAKAAGRLPALAFVSAVVLAARLRGRAGAAVAAVAATRTLIVRAVAAEVMAAMAVSLWLRWTARRQRPGPLPQMLMACCACRVLRF